AGFPFVIDTSTASSTESFPKCSGFLFGKGVWFKFAPPISGSVAVSTCGSDFDTVLQVYAGDCTALTPVSAGCNDDDGPVCLGTSASLATTGSPGTTSYIL